MSLLGGAGVLGVDLTDAYANKPRPNDVCELRPDSASGAPRLVARFSQWDWSTERRGELCDPDAILAKIRSSSSSMIDGPQGLASIGNHMRQCERECGAPGRTPDRIDNNNKSSVGLFKWLHGKGLKVSPSHFRGGVSEVFPGDIWRRLSGGRLLHEKNTDEGRYERKAILEFFGVNGLPVLPTHDQNDACVGALLAAASVGWVSGMEVKGIGAELVVDENGVLREGQMVVPTLTPEKQTGVLKALESRDNHINPCIDSIVRPQEPRLFLETSNMPLFDAYIFIDWSAKNRLDPNPPRADAVWTGEYVPALQHQLETYHRSRHSAFAHVLAFALRQISDRRRVLVGFDFPYGFPQGFAQALGLANGPMVWSSVWADLAQRIQDTANNESNRFVVASDLNALIGGANIGPFWGCPAAQANLNLDTHSPGFPFQSNNGTALPRLRIPESRLPGTQETWRLYGNGSVGSQALVGIPYVHQLRHHAQLQHCSKVWPFETQFTNAASPATGPFILHAEIWPGVVNAQVAALMAANQQLIRDQAQVRAMCNWASELDVQGALGQYFAIPQNLTPAQVQVCTEQEGWVLGAV